MFSSSFHLGPVHRYLEGRFGEFLSIFEQMVGINSFTCNPAGVNRVGELSAQVFDALGFKPRFVQAANPKFGQHLILSRDGERRERVGFVSHLDTVFTEEEEQTNDFRWRPQGDRIYGPGTVDIKGGTIVALMTLSALRDVYPAEFERFSWRVLLNAAEERLAPDFGHLCAEELKEHGLAALVFEAGLMEGESYRVVTSRKGRATFKVRVNGRSSHAGVDHKRGANAIVQLAEVVGILARITDHSRDLTCNVGFVSGGEGVNRVSQFAELEGELRAFDSDILAQAVALVRGLDGYSTVASLEDGFPCAVGVEFDEVCPGWAPNDRTNRLFDGWRSAGAELGFHVVSESRGGLSDGCYTCAILPTIDGLGPTGHNDHCSERSPDGSKDQEYVLPGTMIPRAMLNVAGVLRLVGECAA